MHPAALPPGVVPVNDNMAAHLAMLSLAAAEGDAEAVARHAGAILEAGDQESCRAAIRHAERALGREASALVADAFEEQAQMAVVGGEEARLYCMGFLIDPDKSAPFPAAAMRALLGAAAADGERVAVAEGWVHLSDLLDLSPARYRATARHLGCAASAGAALSPLPAADFPRFPANATDGGGAEFLSTAGAMASVVVRRVAARFVLFAVVGDAPGGGLGSLMLADPGTPRLEALVDAAQRLVGGARAALEPGQPIDCAVGAAATLDTMVLDARFDAAAARLGAKPVAHICVGETAFHVVMASEDGTVVDALDLCGTGLDIDWVADIVSSQSAIVVHHETPEGLPRPARGAVN